MSSVIVMSSTKYFVDVLDIIGEALDENDIPYASLHEAGGNQSKFKRNIQKFKVCLVLLLSY